MKLIFRVVTFFALINLCSCASMQQLPPPPPPPEPPLVLPFGDNANWILMRDMNYRIGNTKEVITVPQGFVTDFASIPPKLAVFGLSPHGQFSRAAVIHDFLYWAQPCSKDQADRLLLIAMKESSVGKFDAFAVYEGVHNFGNSSWESNKNQRKLGRFRVIPGEYLERDDPNITWPQYQQILNLKDVKDLEFQKNPTYCKIGDQSAVPE